MRKQIIWIPIVLVIALFGCNKQEIKDVNRDVVLLQDSINTIIAQHNAMLDSIAKVIDVMDETTFDIKAYKMEQVASLFEAIARQPEAADFLISSTEMLYTDYTVLLPFIDKAVIQRGKARGIAFGALFASMARQPEAYSILDSAAEKFLGAYNPTYINSELLEITKAASFSELQDAIARQPEADSLFNLATKKYLNFEIIQ